MKNTTLRETLNSIPKGTPIKIGAKVGFFYCYYKNDGCEQVIQSISDKYIHDLYQLLFSKVNEFNDLDNKLERNIEKAKKMKYKTAKQKQQRIEKCQKRHDSQKKLLPKQIDTLRKKVNAFKPLLDRNVKNIYQLKMPTYENPKTIYIWVSGGEQGNYCDLHEYAKDKHLKIKSEDSQWVSLLKNREEKDKERKRLQANLELVKKKKGTKYKLVRDENGIALGLVEIKPKKESK